MELMELAVDDILVGERMRKEYDLDEEFLDSIREKGVIQPVTVNQNLELMAGGRRLAASKELEISTIKALVRQSDDELDLREVEYIENAFRKDLNWKDRNASIAKMHILLEEKYKDNPTKERWSLRKTARLIDRSIGGVSRCIKMHEEITKFPMLGDLKSEDEAVKVLRQLKEAFVTKTKVKAHEERVKESEKQETEKEEKPKEKIDPRIQNALSAKNHYQVGDAFKGMEQMIDQGLNPPISFVEIDPPYAIDLKKVKKGENKKLADYEEIPKEEYPEFLKDLCELVYMTTPDNTRICFWFGVEWYETVRNALTTAGFKVDTIPCVWTKRAGQTNSPELYLARAWEPFLIAWKGDGIPIRNRGRTNVFDFPVVPASRKYHPTQRPVELMQDILRTFAWEGSIIMVPFLGSGATLLAAYREGMYGFGWDLNEKNREPFLAAVETDIEEYYPKTTDVVDKSRDSDSSQVDMEDAVANAELEETSLDELSDEEFADAYLEQLSIDEEQ